MAYVVDPAQQAQLAQQLYEQAKGGESWGPFGFKFELPKPIAEVLAYDLLKLVGEAAGYRGALSQKWIERDATDKVERIIGPVIIASLGTALAVTVGVAGLSKHRRRKR